MKTRSEAGFTLVELMVVIVLIGLLAGVVTTQVFPILFKGKNTTAQSQIAEIEKAIEFYYLNRSRYPESLDELIQPDPEGGWPNGYLNSQAIPLDPWGEEYIYDPEGGTTKAYLLFSKGADLIEGNEDDITNEKGKGTTP